MHRKLTFPSLAFQCGLLACTLAIYHFVLRFFMAEFGLRLGAVSAKLVPLYAYWRPHVKGWLLVPLVVLAAYFVVLRRTRVATSLTDRGAVAFFLVAFVAITTSVAMLDDGPQSIVAPLLRTDLEYFGGIDRVHSVREFLRDYPRQASTMPMHAQVHPPGAILFVWAACKLFGGGPWAAAGAIIAFSSISVWLVYRWAERLGGPGVARRAAALFVLTPSVVLFTATSMDGPFAVFLIATMWLFWEALNSRPFLFGSLAGLAGATAALMTYSVAVAMLFCGVAACVSWFVLADRRRSTLVAATAACAAFVCCHVLLWAATGFDPIEMFRAAVANDSRIMNGAHHDSPSRYFHLAVGNFVVFFIAAGLACTVVWWPTVLDSIFMRPRCANHRSPTTDHRSPITHHLRLFSITAVLTLLIAAAVPVYVLEVERVWMFLVPLVLIPVARLLFEHEWCDGKPRATLAVAALLAAQTLATEVLLTTYW